jgi:hypothetical protein
MFDVAPAVIHVALLFQVKEVEAALLNVSEWSVALSEEHHSLLVTA